MNSHSPAFLGVYDTEVGKLDGSSHLDLTFEIGAGCVADAGIEWGRIDGLLTVKPQIGAHARHSASVAEYLGLSDQLAVCRTVDDGGASPLIAAITAFELVESGVCSAVLVVAADTLRTGQPMQHTLQQFAGMRHAVWEQPVGVTTLSAYALVADAYLSRYGLEQSALAPIPVAMRTAASTHPGARFREPLSVDDVRASPVVSAPLRQLECTALSDGGAGFIVGRRSLAHDRAVGRLLGYGDGTRYDSLAFAAELTRNGSDLSMARAFTAAGVGIDDLDLALLYDSYSIALALQLESLGACEAGGAGRYVAEAGLGSASPLPVNTHGGLLSHGHCGSAAGMQHITELVRQFRGEAANQVDGVEMAFVHGEGGVLSLNTSAIFGVD